MINETQKAVAVLLIDAGFADAEIHRVLEAVLAGFRRQYEAGRRGEQERR